MNFEERDEKIWNFHDGSKVWFTSDTHFGHENIIGYCSRPFVNVHEMNEALINNWNSVVNPDDTVFHLGDFAIGGSQLWNETLNRLNGDIILVQGNHDRKNLRQGYIKRFLNVSPKLHIVVEGQSICLNHEPLLCYARWEKRVWQLFGHVHSGPKSTSSDLPRLQHLLPTQYDVGVDNNDYYPISFNEVKLKIEKQLELWMNSKKNE